MRAMEADAYAAYRAAISLSGTIVCVGLVFMIVDPFPGSSPLTQSRVIAIMVNVGIAVALWLRRKQPSLRLGLFAFAMASIPVLVNTALNFPAHEDLRMAWEPMLRVKFIVLLTAMFAPRIWLGSLVIVAYAVLACVAYWFTGLPYRANALLFEPWATLIIAVIAEGLLVTRARHQKQELALARQLEKLRAAERIARMALAVRDVANTPLQTLEIRITLLEKADPGNGSNLAAMKRAVARLAKLNERLRRYESDGSWPEGETLDSSSLLVEEAPAKNVEPQENEPSAPSSR